MKKIIPVLIIALLLCSSCKKGVDEDVCFDVGVPSAQECAFEAQYIRVYSESDSAVPVTLIRSAAELAAYKQTLTFDLDYDGSQYSDGTISFNMATEKFTDEFFETKQLVICAVTEPSGSNRHKVQKITYSTDKTLDIYIDRILPECGTEDIADWQIITELDKTCSPNTVYDIDVYLDGENTAVPEKAVYESGVISISLTLEKGWSYYPLEDQIGIAIHPTECDPDAALQIIYRDIPLGLCGTGLETEDITVGTYNGRACTYDNAALWNFVFLETNCDGYEIVNSGALNWWDTYGDAAMRILNTLKLSDSAITSEEAKKIAVNECTIEYTYEYADYDPKNGNWIVTYKNGGITETVTVDDSGSVIQVQYD